MDYLKPRPGLSRAQNLGKQTKANNNTVVNINIWGEKHLRDVDQRRTIEGNSGIIRTGTDSGDWSSRAASVTTG